MLLLPLRACAWRSERAHASIWYLKSLFRFICMFEMSLVNKYVDRNFTGKVNPIEPRLMLRRSFTRNCLRFSIEVSMCHGL